MTPTHHHLVRKRPLNHLVNLASLVKCLVKSLLKLLVCVWLWVRMTLLSIKLQIRHILQARSSFTQRQTIECGFTLKLVCDMIITYSQKKRNYQFLEKLSSTWFQFIVHSFADHQLTELPFKIVEWLLHYVSLSFQLRLEDFKLIVPHDKNKIWICSFSSSFVIQASVECPKVSFVPLSFRRLLNVPRFQF